MVSCNKKKQLYTKGIESRKANGETKAIQTAELQLPASLSTQHADYARVLA